MTAGLRLSARLDAQRGLVRYEVENVGERPFRYLQGRLGHGLEVRRVGEEPWTELAARPDAIRFLSGMGPVPADLRTLEPGAALPRDAFHAFVDQRRFAPDGTPRAGLDLPPASEAFTLDLLDHVWPASLGDLGDGALELRVVLVLPDWADLRVERTWSGRVPSATLRLELATVPPLVRAELDRGGA